MDGGLKGPNVMGISAEEKSLLIICQEKLDIRCFSVNTLP